MQAEHQRLSLRRALGLGVDMPGSDQTDQAITLSIET
jgi:hypothetical protein